VTDLETTVATTEQLSRYIIESKKMRPAQGRAHHTAFMPPPNRRLSVYRTSDLDEDAIWEIGREFVAGPLQKTLYARADLQAAEVTACQLRTEPAPAVHPRHANIEGWPDDDAQVRQFALVLSQRARLIQVPDTQS